jgi:hypothetical protein
MAYLKIKHIGDGSYYYIVQSVRRGGKVSQRVLEYLGRNPDPKRLARAMKYWGVKVKPKVARG